MNLLHGKDRKFKAKFGDRSIDLTATPAVALRAGYDSIRFHTPTDSPHPIRTSGLQTLAEQTLGDPVDADLEFAAVMHSTLFQLPLLSCTWVATIFPVMGQFPNCASGESPSAAATGCPAGQAEPKLRPHLALD